MAKYKANVCAWFTVEFDDDGKTVLQDQAHDAALDFISVLFSQLDDMEVHDVNIVEEKQ